MPLRRLLGLSAAVSAPLRRGFSTGASCPPWVMIGKYVRVNPPEPLPRASLRLAEPPSASHLVVHGHLIRKPRGPDPVSGDVSLLFGGFVKATIGDGLLLLHFFDFIGSPFVVATRGGDLKNKLAGIHPDVTRAVCNPISGELVRLPDMDGTKKTMWFTDTGILTRSERPHGRPDRYAVADLTAVDRGGEEQSFVMRRFLSETGKWDKLVGLPSPLPALGRRMYMNTLHEAVAFAGRLWWVDTSWGAISADPFSDRPELRFVELPRGSVTEPVGRQRPGKELVRYRRMGVSEGRLRYIEVSKEEPFVLSSFSLDDDCRSWTLEHRVALRRLWPHEDLCKDMPQIAVIDPLSASIAHLTIGKQALSIDMGNGNLLGCTLRGEGDGLVPFPKPCLLPAWLASSPIPCAGDLTYHMVSLRYIHA
ncbi:hypothetical protein EJB05_35917, partial [Eragrostis curvula]